MLKFIVGLLFLLSVSCSIPYALAQTPPPTRPTITQAPSLPSETHTSQPTPTATITPSPRPSATLTATAAATMSAAGGRQGAACTFHPITAQLLEQTSQEQWIDWVAKLSGAEPVTINGEETLIETRYSPSLFNGQPNARAFDWLVEQVAQWYPAEQIEEQPYQVEHDGQRLTWKNLIITIPGQTRPEEIVVLSAHLDSTSTDPEIRAPGAEDNASGSAALLEAARIFREAHFERTIQIVWFTGEEQRLFGSEAYVQNALANHQQIIGAINLDMFGYDSDDDRCFELHVGRLPASQAIGKCFQNSIDSYVPELEADVLTSEAIDRSDHGSFWSSGLGAIEVLENLFDNQQPTGCSNRDPSPHYHTDEDVVANLNPETGFLIAKASLAAFSGMARPVEP